MMSEIGLLQRLSVRWCTVVTDVKVDYVIYGQNSRIFNK